MQAYISIEPSQQCMMIIATKSLLFTIKTVRYAESESKFRKHEYP